MGMDVFGDAPDNEEGKYFRNNVWWWRPLWDYCEQVAPTLLEGNGGHYNDGWGLSKRDALALAKRLREEISSGRTANYQTMYYVAQNSIPEEVCEYCKGTGVRTDKVGQEMNYADKLNPETGKIGWCNGCNGKGTSKPFSTWYDFSVENVELFATFLEHSGGFKIW